MAVNKENVKIHVSHLQKSFGNLEVLKDVSTDICEGEVVVILGPSGSGKSTFLRCLNRLEEITGGEVVVDGHDLTDKKTDINKVRENVGMVFQHFNLFNNLNVMGNMTLAPTELKKASKAQAKENALRLLSRVGLADKAEAYPAQLSGGQKQRVAIARALAMNPDIMLFDEPTSALDPEMVGEVLHRGGRYPRRGHQPPQTAPDHRLFEQSSVKNPAGGGKIPVPAAFFAVFPCTNAVFAVLLKNTVGLPL
mgnify:CR=1 FL=1